MTHFVIRSAQDGFRRCGVAHPARDTVHRGDAFSEADWERLGADPRLAVRPAREDEIAAFEAGREPAAARDPEIGLRQDEIERVEAAIRELRIDADFTSRGVPRLPRVREILGADGPTVTAGDVAAVFERMCADGFMRIDPKGGA